MQFEVWRGLRFGSFLESLFSCVLGCLGASWGRLGNVLERLGDVLARLCGFLEASLARLGLALGRLGGILDRLGAVFVAFRERSQEKPRKFNGFGF